MTETSNGYWRGKTIFVTGCTGLVGSWLTARLVDEGANVIGLVWDDEPSPVFCESRLDQLITCVHGDIRDYQLLERVLNQPIDTVFHLAAQALVTVANQSPLETFEINARGTWLLLEAIRRTAGTRRLVVASSDKVYGEQGALPYHETTPLSAKNPYDTSKAAADFAARSYAMTFGLPIAVVRCGNIYGGGDINFDRIIPGTIEAAVQGQRPLIRSDGTFTRDYIYVADAVEAYLKVGQALEDPALWGEAFNFGREYPITVLALVQKICQMVGRQDLEPIVANTARHEIPHQYLSSEKARAMLGWEPKYDLDDGLRETIAWYRRFLTSRPADVSQPAESGPNS